MPQNRRKTGGRSRSTQFQPGQSGNPGGRPKLPLELKAALKTMLPESLEAMRNAINGRNLYTAVRAVNGVFNRLYGMPKQTIEQTGEPSLLVMPESVYKRYAEVRGEKTPGEGDLAPQTDRTADEALESQPPATMP